MMCYMMLSIVIVMDYSLQRYGGTKEKSKDAI